MKLSDEKTLTIIIPALNESENIAITLDQITQFLEKQRVQYEIIVVDDASLDSTSLVAREYGADIVIKNKRTFGKGAAIKRGISEASGSIIVVMNADGSYKPEDILRLIEPISEGKADLVIGSEYAPSIRERNLLQAFGSYYFYIVSYLLLGVTIHDFWSGFRAYSAQVLTNLLKYRLSSGYAFDIEIMYLAEKQGYRVKEIPIRTRLRKSFGYSERVSFRPRFLDGFRILKAILTSIVKYEE